MPSPSLPAAVPLLPELAFVVQLQADSPLGPEQLAGRVEHVASGQATRFVTLQELQDFIVGRTADAPR